MERTVAEKDAELKELRADLEEAQEEASAQEDAAELARGELDEYRRRLQDEVEHARQEALLAARDESSCASLNPVHSSCIPKVTKLKGMTSYLPSIRGMTCSDLLSSPLSTVC